MLGPFQAGKGLRDGLALNQDEAALLARDF